MSDGKVFQSVWGGGGGGRVLRKKIPHRMSSNYNEESQESF